MLDKKKSGFSKLSSLWDFRCDAMRCLLLVYRGFDRGGAGRGRQGRDGRASGFRKLLLCFFFFVLFFFNIVLTWKFVGASKVSVLYVCIYIYIYI